MIRRCGILLLTLVFTLWEHRAPAQTTVFNFTSFTSPTNLLMAGLSSIVSGHLRLTDAATGEVGAGWYPTKVTVHQGFRTTFQFQITNQVSGGGDGFAFVIQNGAIPQMCGGGGSMGYNQMRNSIAVEFDTFHDTFDPPQTNTPYRELSIHSSGVFANSVTNGPSTLVTLQDFTNFADGNVHTGEVDYTPGTLSLFLDGVLTVSANVNLDTLLALDNGQAWVGFTGATGAVWERHDIYNWAFFASNQPITSIALTNPISGSSFTAPASFALGATASTANSAITQISYYEGTNFLGTASNAPWSVAVSNLSAGKYYVTAVAQDNTGATSTSAQQVLTVHPPLPPIGFNFACGTNTTNALLPNGNSGFIVQSNWNNIFCNSNGTASLGAVTDGAGILSAMGINVVSAGPGQEENYKTNFSPEYTLMASYVEDLGAANPGQIGSAITVSNIPFGAYDVVVYTCVENRAGLADRVGQYTIGNQSIFIRDAANTDFAGAYAAANSTADLNTNTPSGNFVRFRNLSAKDFTLTFAAGSTFNTSPLAAVDALQIVPTSLLPALSAQLAGTNVIVSWPTNFPGFTLQFTSDLTSPWTNITAPLTVTNGRNFLTNSFPTGSGFYRLMQ